MATLATVLNQLLAPNAAAARERARAKTSRRVPRTTRSRTTRLASHPTRYTAAAVPTLRRPAAASTTMARAGTTLEMTPAT